MFMNLPVGDDVIDESDDQDDDVSSGDEHKDEEQQVRSLFLCLMPVLLNKELS